GRGGRAGRNISAFSTTPSAPIRRLRGIFLDVASTPPRGGGEWLRPTFFRSATIPGMKPLSVVLGAVTGALLVLSLPKPDLYPLAWIALVPLLTVIAGKASIPESMLASYIAGVIFFGGTCYWITETMYIYGGLSPTEAFGVGALFALMHGFYFVLFGL